MMPDTSQQNNTNGGFGPHTNKRHAMTEANRMTYANLPQPIGEIFAFGDYAWCVLMKVTNDTPWCIYRWCKDNDEVKIANAEMNVLRRQNRIVDWNLKEVHPGRSKLND
jgi:hypothetical protein